jgi:hypothetical protein
MFHMEKILVQEVNYDVSMTRWARGKSTVEVVGS